MEMFTLSGIPGVGVTTCSPDEAGKFFANVMGMLEQRAPVPSGIDSVEDLLASVFGVDARAKAKADGCDCDDRAVPTERWEYNPVNSFDRVTLPMPVRFIPGKTSVVFFDDGTKEIVTCSEGTEYSEYSAFCAACMKHMFGNNTKLKRFIESIRVEQKKRKKKEA